MSEYPGPEFHGDGPGRQPKAGSMESTREQAREMAEQVEERARAKGREIRERMESKGEEQKGRAVETADALADAIRSASTTLRDRQEERLGQITDELADQLDRFSGYLRDHDVRGLVDDLEHVARRNPAAFLGGTLAVGLMAGRFLRATRPEQQHADGDGMNAGMGARPPSHREFASNSPTPELHVPHEAADSSSPTRESISRRETTHTAGGPTP